MRYQQQREELLRTALEIYESKMVSGTWGNVSIRIDDNLLLITPSGMDYRSLQAEDMVLVDYNLNIVEGQYKPSIESPLHRDIYSKRKDINAVVHVHSNYACVFAVARKPIPVVLEETAQIIGHPIEVVPYAHCGSEELAAKTTEYLKNSNAVLLANHGLVGIGKTLRDALRICNIAEKTAMITLMATQLGDVNSLTEEEVFILRKDFANYGQSKSVEGVK